MHADGLRADLVVEHVDERAIVAGAAGGVLALAPADQPSSVSMRRMAASKSDLTGSLRCWRLVSIGMRTHQA